MKNEQQWPGFLLLKSKPILHCTSIIKEDMQKLKYKKPGDVKLVFTNISLYLFHKTSEK